MIYVKSVTSTMKKGCDIDLGPKTILFGPNGSGKSTVVQAIELATLGRVSDMEGRDEVKQTASLSRLFTENESMSSSCILSNGAIFTWVMEKNSSGGFKKPKPIVPQTIRWPFQELQSILKGEANSVAGWLGRQVLGEMTKKDLLGLVPPEMRNDADLLIRKANTVDFLVLSKEGKDEARRMRTNATRMEKTAEKILEGIKPPLLASERVLLEKELVSILEEEGITQAVFDQLVERGVAHISEKEGVEKELGSLPVGDDSDFSLYQKVLSLRDLIALHAKHFGIDKCAVCGAEDVASSIDERVDQTNMFLAQLNTQAEKLEKRKRLELRLVRLDQLGEEIKSFLSGSKIVEDKTERAAQLHRQIAEDNASKKVWVNASSTKAEVSQIRAQADAFTAVSKVLAEIGKSRIDLMKHTFEEAVNAFLPGYDKLGINIKAGRLGFMRNGKLHSALSGAEWTRLLLALSAVWVGDSTPCVLVPEDRAWDRDTLGHVMEALRDVPAQIILMSTVKPEPVEGWKLVDLT